MAHHQASIKLTAHWVRKLTGKPAFLTIADCESEARRIHIYEARFFQMPPKAMFAVSIRDLLWPSAAYCLVDLLRFRGREPGRELFPLGILCAKLSVFRRFFS